MAGKLQQDRLHPGVVLGRVSVVSSVEVQGEKFAQQGRPVSCSGIVSVLFGSPIRSPPARDGDPECDSGRNQRTDDSQVVSHGRNLDLTTDMFLPSGIRFRTAGDSLRTRLEAADLGVGAFELDALLLVLLAQRRDSLLELFDVALLVSPSPRARCCRRPVAAPRRPTEPVPYRDAARSRRPGRFLRVRIVRRLVSL
ncbi:hypothetical protein [Amycolatopsis sp. WGS_07]|uniref:hypothetical protein n=1 Tax=Amycolatopsis sp. WGS_07 TaxID=3076764 RepID=UPI003873A24C